MTYTPNSLPGRELRVSRNEEINNMRDNGWTLKEIANDFGITEGRVCQIIGKTGVHFRNADWDERVETAFVLDSWGVKRREIESLLGVSNTVIWKNLGKQVKNKEYFHCPTCGKTKPREEFFESEIGHIRACRDCKRKRAMTHNWVTKNNLDKSICYLADGSCEGKIEAHHYSSVDEYDKIYFLCKKHHRDMHRDGMD